MPTIPVTVAIQIIRVLFTKLPDGGMLSSRQPRELAGGTEARREPDLFDRLVDFSVARISPDGGYCGLQQQCKHLL